MAKLILEALGVNPALDGVMRRKEDIAGCVVEGAMGNVGNRVGPKLEFCARGN